MQNLKILNTKEVKELLDAIENCFGVKFGNDYAFLSGKDNKIYIVNKEVSTIDFTKIRVNSIGLYFCEFFEGQIRPSIEGSQILGKNATKNIILLDDKQIALWVRGNDIPVDYSSNDYVIVKNKEDFYGSGKVKDGKLLNFYPKARRIKSVD
jgi:NOL1/NOP2/fmu family ribosome biogenesis protein